MATKLRMLTTHKPCSTSQSLSDMDTRQWYFSGCSLNSAFIIVTTARRWASLEPGIWSLNKQHNLAGRWPRRLPYASDDPVLTHTQSAHSGPSRNGYEPVAHA